jgi:hypothetical protein
MDEQYSPVMLGMTYVNIRAKHFAQYTSKHFNPNHFIVLGKFLEKEQVNPASYFNYIFGILDHKRALLPAKLVSPELVQQYKATIHDEL